MRNLMIKWIAILAVVGWVGTANATVITMHSGSGITANDGGEGGGRGIGFRADSTFSIDSAGIFMNLVSQSYDARIYSSTTGNEAGALLATASAMLGGSGAAFYDIDLNYTFTSGNYYVLHWRPTDLGFADWLAGNTPDGYFFDSALPAVSGPVTLINGVQGTEPTSFGNTLHPNLRMNMVVNNQVPAPATLALMGLGLLAVGFTRRKILN